ncbi:MAG TPA: amidohydrolase family protein [Casimicrobiaceae bacterium]
MRIVDSQVHIWAASTPERPWPPRHAAQREIPLGADELLQSMDAAGVDGAILVPPSWEGERNDLVLAAAAAHPDRFAVMGRVDPDDPSTPERIATWRAQPGMLGLRFSLHRPGLAESLATGNMDAVFRSAEAHDVPIMLLVPHTGMHHIDAVAARYPGLRLVLDHLGIPSSVPAAERFTRLDELLKLARHANVAVKASALPALAEDEYPYRSLHAPMRRVCDAFESRRVFWGSDLSRLPCTYRQAVTQIAQEMPWLSEDDKHWIMGRGVCEWLDWKR